MFPLLFIYQIHKRLLRHFSLAHRAARRLAYHVVSIFATPPYNFIQDPANGISASLG